MKGKNMILLGIEHSNAWQPSIHETIAALQAEIAKGESVYTPEELKKLTGKLEDYEFMLERMLLP